MWWTFRKKTKSDDAYLQLFKEKIKKSTPIDQLEFLVLDTETTGLDPLKDRILSVGAVPASTSRLYTNEAYHIFIQQTTYSREAALIHGIRHNSSQAGIREQEAADQLLELISNKIIVGHHIQFDIEMINQLLLRHKGFSLKNESIDTSTLYKRAFPQNYSYNYRHSSVTLDEVAANFGITAHDRHSALGDAVITGLAFIKILKKLEKKKVRTKGELFRNVRF